MIRQFLLITALFLLILTACNNDQPLPPTLMPIAALATADMESLLASPTPLPTRQPIQVPPTPTWPQSTPISNPQSPISNPQPPTPSPQSQPFALPVNNIPPNIIIQMPPETAANVQAIFARGKGYQRNPRVFSKLGDSAVLTGSYLTRFDNNAYYNLGQYDYLQPVIEYYAGSFARYGTAVKIGLSSFGVLDPMWADKTWCAPDEHMLACEFRLNNPSILLIHIGTNDAMSRAQFAENMRQIIEYSVQQGVIPILASKADRFEGDNRNNEVLYQLATEYNIPLWDFDAVAATLPARGLRADNVHLTVANSNDYTDPNTFSKGYPVSDLTALMALEVILQVTGGDDE